MSKEEAKSKKSRDEDELPSTVSFSGSVIGPGSQIGRFWIEQELGRGGMGVVYLAQDTNLGRPVAIKSLPPEIAENTELLSRLKREAKILASLNHPNIATIYEEFQEEGISYLVMEHIGGDTLAERLSRGPLALEETLSVGLQVAEALSAAHNQNVVHRDLKPGNIKITPEGKVKVLDFGLAKAIGSQYPALQDTTTEPGKIFGTPPYMSPEQARGKPVDYRSDIWSFGCVLYEMLTGKVPFKGETPSDTLVKILGKDPDWQSLPQTTPPNIQVLLRRCLEKNPRSRLQHIGDAVIEIRETLSPPSTAPPMTCPILVSLEPDVAAKTRLRRIAMIIGAIIIVVAAGIAIWFVNKKTSVPFSKEIRLVVLPFENLGPSEDEYFAVGITDAITARLATIHGLGVISRQSAMQYKKREKSTQQIANELRVDYILEGTVQRERPADPNSRVRIIPQLIKASNDTHVWAQAYDNDMSEVFQVQSDLAEQVAQALDITLAERERQALRSRPTENMEAYDYFLRGDEYGRRSELENNFKIAIQMYERAVELDPKFALAYAHLSKSHANMYWYYYDRTEQRLAMAKKAVDKALQLAPDSPETHFALGHYYYHGQSDWDRALEEFAIARKNLPNDSDLLSFIGYVQRRQGKFEEALANIKRASELDPLSNIKASELGETFELMRNYPEAMRYYNRAISLAPDVPGAYYDKSGLYLLWEGNKEKARMVIEQAAQNIGSFGEDPFLVLMSVRLNVLDGKYQEALAQLSSCKVEAFSSQFVFIPKAQVYAQINGLMGNKEVEQAQYESAASILETRIQQEPNDARFHSSLGIAYAGLGRKQDAIREGRLAVGLLPVNKDAMRGYSRATDLARIYVMVGEFDLAIDHIEFLLSIPGGLSIPLLRLEPVWAPLREHPRFKKFLEAKE
jgi:serine/threonine protein kinase/tetratricopeptide (TPR) repeat protein